MKAVCLSIILCFSLSALALENDPFFIPPKPLSDLTPLIARQVRNCLLTLDNLNEAQDHLYRCLGQGLLYAKLEGWAESSREIAEEFRFRPVYKFSIYSNAWSPVPGVLRLLSATVNLSGNYVGTDKLGHFSQQGYQYFKVYHRLLKQNGDVSRAMRLTVNLGRLQESSYYGQLLTGVYSNGDLAANYSGFKFYENLTAPIVIDGATLAPLLAENKLLPSEKKVAEYLKRFFTPLWNEAVNPCDYGMNFQKVQVKVSHRCQDLGFPETPATTFDPSLWHGEEYGHYVNSHRQLQIPVLCQVAFGFAPR